MAAKTDLKYLVGRIASDIEATEAAVFSVDQTVAPPRLMSLLHLRADNSDAATRGKAVAAFKELVLTCLAREMDGAIEVAGASASRSSQYCLITFARHNDQIIAAAAFIIRCRDLADAQSILTRLQQGTICL